MSWFSGSGQVPADNYVYRWSDDPSHYLIERMGTAGAYIKEIGVGSRVIIDGQSYAVFKGVGANGGFDLTIWYTHPS